MQDLCLMVSEKPRIGNGILVTQLCSALTKAKILFYMRTEFFFIETSGNWGVGMGTG